MKNNYFYLLVLSLISFNISAQFPSPYCEIEEYYDVEEITTISFDGLSFTNTNTTDILVDLTSVYVDVVPGEEYTISLQGNTYEDYTNEFVVFVDWNQNGILDDSGEVYYIGSIFDSTGSDSQSASATITVPSTATPGATRARITKTYTDEEFEVFLIIDPCNIMYDDWWFGPEGSFGQAIDITVNVIEDVVDECADYAAPIGENNQTFVAGDTLADLNVTGEGLNWYADEELQNEIETDTVLVHGETYFVINTNENCQSEALAITVQDICNGFEAPEGENNQTFVDGDTLANLTVTGEGLTWYADEELENEIEADTVLVHGETYFVVSTNENCQSEALAITVQDICNGFEAPEGENNQTFVDGDTLDSLTVTGEGLTWYADEELENEIEADTVLEDGKTYFVVNTNENCESEALAITVTETLSNSNFGNISFSYFPNPVQEVIYLSSDKIISQISVFNLLGQKLDVNTNSDYTQIDMSNLSSGNYLLNISIENTTKTIKIVKK